MVPELVKNNLGQQGPLRHTGQLGQQGNSQMGTASQQQHADQPGQHGSEPYALKAPGFLGKLRDDVSHVPTGHLQQRGHRGRHCILHQSGESPQPAPLQIHQSAVADSVQHGDTSIRKRPPQGSRRPHDCNLPRTQQGSIGKQYRRSIVLLHAPTSRRRSKPCRSSPVGRIAVAATVAVVGVVPREISASSALTRSALEDS